jgi:M6 family metalloprotease-like protein
MKILVLAIISVIIFGLIGFSSPIPACSIGDDPTIIAKTGKSDSTLLSPRPITASYLGPGGRDYRDGQLAKYLQRRKAARSSAPAGPFPPPAAPTTLEVKVPVILIEYPDAPMTVTTSEIEDLMFGSGSSPNMTEYYEEVSYGQVSIDGDVYGPYQVSTDYTDYAAYDREAFITEAVELSDGDVDYSQYDADGDGYVDAVIVVASEYIQVMGGEPAHRSYISDYTTDEGMIVRDYTSQKEDCEVGTYCHEFGHILGLPDLYATNIYLGGAGRDCTIGNWGLMGSGNHNDPPAHFCGWCKIELGWLEPIEITESVDDLSIGNVEEYGEIYKLAIPGMITDEYLLVENRQLIGSDAGLPGDGLLVWHIGYQDEGTVLIPAATGDPEAVASDGSDPFPGSDNAREYIDETFGIEISDISDSGDIMTADFTIPEGIEGWRAQENPAENDLNAVCFTDDDTGWAAGEFGTIIHTDDGGDNWEEQESGTEEDLQALCFTDSSTGWAVGEGGTILYTSNGGDTWEVQDSGVTEDINSVSFIDSSTGWALTNDSTVLSTSDGGSIWESDNLNTDGEVPVEVEFASNDYGFVAGRDGTLFCTNDGGDTWSDWTVVEDEVSYSIEIAGLRARADNDLWMVGSISNGYDYLFWIWEGNITYFSLYNTVFNDVDFEERLGVVAGERIVVMNCDSDYGFGLDLFSLSGGADHQMDTMEWIEVQEWLDNLEDTPLAVDVVSGDVAYVVGENGLILRYDKPPLNVLIERERSVTPVTLFDPEWAVDNPAVYPIDPTRTMPEQSHYYMDYWKTATDRLNPADTANYRDTGILEYAAEQQTISATTPINTIDSLR